VITVLAKEHLPARLDLAPIERTEAVADDACVD